MSAELVPLPAATVTLVRDGAEGPEVLMMQRNLNSGFVPGAQALAWKQWPGMAMNPEFDEGIQALGATGQKLVLLCRSGVRSIAAAQRATELGLEAYNILEGFEGDPDANAHRGHKGGWRLRGLPWQQS